MRTADPATETWRLFTSTGPVHQWHAIGAAPALAIDIVCSMSLMDLGSGELRGEPPEPRHRSKGERSGPESKPRHEAPTEARSHRQLSPWTASAQGLHEDRQIVRVTTITVSRTCSPGV